MFFPLTPKFHFLLHVAADLKEQLSRMQSTDRYILNPGLFATQMAEDATGRSLPHGSNLPRPDCQCAGGPKMAHRNQTLLG